LKLKLYIIIIDFPFDVAWQLG